MLKHTLIHIPHASLHIPDDMRAELLPTQTKIDQELLLMADRYTDDIYDYDGAMHHTNEVARIVFDPERFREKQDESMEKHGMGAIYTRTLDGKRLRDLTDEQRETLLQRFYDPYHEQLTDKVERMLAKHSRCLIIDGHSFPSRPLAFERDKHRARPDICLGVDPFHTPDELVDKARLFATKRGYSVDINHPFAGTLVPMKYYGKDKRVSSIMIEINRKLYMDEKTGAKNSTYDHTKTFIHALIDAIIEDSKE